MEITKNKDIFIPTKKSNDNQINEIQYTLNDYVNLKSKVDNIFKSLNNELEILEVKYTDVITNLNLLDKFLIEKIKELEK